MKVPFLEISESRHERERNDEFLEVLKGLKECICGLQDVEQQRLDVEEQILEELKRHRSPAVRAIVRLGKPIDQ